MKNIIYLHFFLYIFWTLARISLTSLLGKEPFFFFQNTNYEHFLKILINDVILQTAAQRSVNNIYIYIYCVCMYLRVLSSYHDSIREKLDATVSQSRSSKFKITEVAAKHLGRHGYYIIQ